MPLLNSSVGEDYCVFLLFFFFSFHLLLGSTLLLLCVNFCSVLAELILGERGSAFPQLPLCEEHSGCDDGLQV